MTTTKICPNCESDDIFVTNFDPDPCFGGALAEGCGDCGKSWSVEDEGPSDDEWINAAYEAQADAAEVRRRSSGQALCMQAMLD